MTFYRFALVIEILVVPDAHDVSFDLGNQCIPHPGGGVGFLPVGVYGVVRSEHMARLVLDARFRPVDDEPDATSSVARS